MYIDSTSYTSRNFQLIYKKNLKFFGNLTMFNYKKISIQKKKNIFIIFVLKITNPLLIIGCVSSLTLEKGIIIGLYCYKNYYNMKQFYLFRNKIYGKNHSCIEIKNCITVSDIVIAKIDQKNQHILKIHDANLGVLLSIGCQNHFMIPRNNYEMLCCVTQKRKFKKVSKLSLW